MLLADLKTGESGIIVKVKGRGAFRKRIIEMGFVPGKKIAVIKNAPLQDPIEYKIMDYYVTLRRSEAKLVEVNAGAADGPERAEAAGSRLAEGVRARRGAQGSEPDKGRSRTFAKKVKRTWNAGKKDGGLRTINVALVGNPNSGKTTLFNLLSGSHDRVGNYSGVTVDVTEASLTANGYAFNIADLPGTYSITEYTPEELFVRNYIFDHAPDVVINVLDSSNIERNLYLTTQLIDMDIKVVAALNMYDELGKKGDEFDYETLGKMIGIPFVPTVSTKAAGIDNLLKKVIEVFEDSETTARHIHIDYNADVERSIKAIQDKIWVKENYALTDKISSRFLAIKLLEKDKSVEETIFRSCQNRTEILQVTVTEIQRLEHLLKGESESIIADIKYAFIAGALRETYKKAKRLDVTRTDKIDNILTHRIFGIPIFMLFAFVTFQLTFVLGQYPMDWIESGFEALSNFVTAVMPEGALRDLIADGIIGGVGSVLVFVPNILILFFLISLMEDTGYMARTVFMMDRLMHGMGLHGRSFIPMFVGFGCNVPALISTRAIRSRNDRLLTLLIIPFMSCSARLPVYLLFVAAFFQEKAGLMLFGLYMIGVAAAVISAIVFKKAFFKGSDEPFVMELPPYRIPTAASTLHHMWQKGSQYIQKVGGVILIVAVIAWALTRYPENPNYQRDYAAEISAAEQIYEGVAAAKYKSDEERDKAIEKAGAAKDKAVSEIRLARESERIEKSYIGRMGKFIEPAFAPLGFDWRMSVSLLTGIAAKEVVVGTMGVFYSADMGADKKNSQSLINRLNGKETGKALYTPLAVFAFLVFVLLYSPCAAALATVGREAGSWKWVLFTIVYTTTAAWTAAFLIYQTGSRIFGL
ncbi:MAG: ferrous iron transport protein B [Leptospirales bacterium]|nr:ferrous iron transport protein B [Leptospirales bacterium]